MSALLCAQNCPQLAQAARKVKRALSGRDCRRPPAAHTKAPILCPCWLTLSYTLAPYLSCAHEANDCVCKIGVDTCTNKNMSFELIVCLANSSATLAIVHKL